jgi:hypothetical protein
MKEIRVRNKPHAMPLLLFHRPVQVSAVFGASSPGPSIVFSPTGCSASGREAAWGTSASNRNMTTLSSPFRAAVRWARIRPVHSKASPKQAMHRTGSQGYRSAPLMRH